MGAEPFGGEAGGVRRPAVAEGADLHVERAVLDNGVPVAHGAVAEDESAHHAFLAEVGGKPVRGVESVEKRQQEGVGRQERRQGIARGREGVGLDGKKDEVGRRGRAGRVGVVEIEGLPVEGRRRPPVARDAVGPGDGAEALPATEPRQNARGEHRANRPQSPERHMANGNGGGRHGGNLQSPRYLEI